MIIVLLGYMASGKTTIGKMIQYKTNLKWIDLDAKIVQKEGKSINEIFEEKGEIYFRKIEREVLLDLLKIDNQVISLGGGTPCYYNNIEKINKVASSIYLRVTVKELVRRIQLFDSNRPLVKNKTEEELQEFVAKHLFERNAFYEKANFILSTENKTFEEITTEIINKTIKEEI